MEESIRKISRNNKIIDNIDNGFVVAFFLLIITTLLNYKLGFFFLFVIFAYFIVYFCYLTPFFKRTEENFKKEVYQQCAVQLNEWINENSTYKEAYDEYMETSFNEMREKAYQEGLSADLLNIEKDIMAIKNEDN